MVKIFYRNHGVLDTTILGANAALKIGDIIVAPAVKNFILKNLRSNFHIDVPDLGDAFTIVLADDDATAAEIAAGLVNTEQDMEDNTEFPLGQTLARRVWAFFTPELQGIAAGGAIQVQHQWKLPPKGIPVLKGSGVSIYVFNFDKVNAFTNGPNFRGIHKMMGDFF